MAFQAPIDKVVVMVETKYIKNFTTIMKMAAIQNNTSIEPADYVNIVGKVISVPFRISNKREYVGFSAKNILPGDTAIFSHSVIYDFCQTDPEAEPIYRNLVWYKGKEYFVADITHIYAIIRDDKLMMQNGYVMLTNMGETPKIYLTQGQKRKVSAASATVSQAQGGKDYWQGSEVYYNPNKIRLYQINGKPFGIVRDRDILGVKKS